MSKERNHQELLQKAAMYDLLSCYYKYSNPTMHTAYYQKHLKYMHKAVQSMHHDMITRNTPARVRVLHASPDAPNVDVYVNENRVLQNFPFKEVSDYLSLPAGKYQIDIYPAGDMVNNVLSRKVAIEGGKQYTVAAADTVKKLRLITLVDEPFVPTGETKVRFVHLSPDAPAVDIAVKNGDVIFSNVAFKQVSKYLPLMPMTVDLEVRLAGTKTVVLPLPALTFRANQVYTAVAVGFADGEPSLEALVLTER